MSADVRSTPHAYASTPRSRTCAVCGSGANASIHKPAALDNVTLDSRVHRLDRSEDRCRCGGQWVWWEAYAELPGVYGCDQQGHADAHAHNQGRDSNDRLVEQ